MYPYRHALLLWLALLSGCLHLKMCVASAPTKGLVLRIRLADGTVEKIAVPNGSEETMTISDVLEPFEV